MAYDLIIVGGGPGGATAAKIAAERGSNVLLLEAGEEGRYKCCAGGIPVSNEDFTPIPHGVGEREITGGVIVTPKNGPMEFDTTEEKDKGYCMFRTDFDKYLVDIAHDAGTQVIYGYRAKEIEINSKGVLVKGPKEYRSKCAILATGLGGARLQRSLGMEVPPMISGIQAEFEIPESVITEQFGNRVWEFFDRTISDHGIAWAFPKQEAVSVGILGKNIKIRNFKSFLRYPFIKDKLKGREMKVFGCHKIWAAPIPDRLIAKPYREHVMIIGDACGTADPILYEGIYQARLSGKLAAEIFCKALEEGDFGESSLARYHHLLLKQLYEEDLRYSYKLHTLLYHSGLLEKVIDAAYSMAQEDPEMMQSMIALFTRSQTRKQIWKVMLSHKRKLIKHLGISSSLRLIPSLFRTSRI
ncbi:MAG: NAD(P)/FAD-dependent oxidoreductase [Candidatus Lokiarchaeota archaeon]|nr:NAD(P)/FAD-dependent oxidoreductase [Candidatus Lokiarchaeota archaeon]